ncbi:hypothetical protein AGABI2DRAFT_194553 [Agaricus bisporus var. bisporus H97]|uniref:hypothetical protein n=1 Tax=Agaricus bisporus var. bisporus (strain H97 / ATCC MYA-4626 / FGSC 10389) TaxID=936046 RepID=UPI00029F7808|nr:hypothetical protein AGABI2DRAFT_194553 [Agaricus bisporus var. bisporus H97]EKV44543.1 hypothetical protein AGABI2DRAFT_194553 [Agaricus bisporus var. bisporus H97]
MVKASDVVLILVAIIFPPAAALIITGCSCDFLINVLLTCLGYLPGHIHAFWLIYKKMQAEERFGHDGYRYIGSGHYEPLYNNAAPPIPYPQQQQQPMPQQAPQYYGSTDNH